MYWTEGFLNQETYFAQGYIQKAAIRRNGAWCMVWCVGACKLPKGLLADWLQQEMVLQKGKEQVQRKVQRLQNVVKTFQREAVLHLFYRGRIYTLGAVKPIFAQYREHRGCILVLYGKVDTASLDTAAFEEKSMEETANAWKRNMLWAMSAGNLQEGYFLLWEERDDF